MTGRFWPRRLSGQLLLTIVLALVIAQLLNGILLYRAQRAQFEQQVSAALALRLIGASERLDRREARDEALLAGDGLGAGRGLRRARLLQASPITPDMRSAPAIERRVADILQSYGANMGDVQVGIAPFVARSDDRLEALRSLRAERAGRPLRQFAIAAVQRGDGLWLATRAALPDRGNRLAAMLLFQTIVLLIVLLVPAVILTRKLSASLETLRSSVTDFEARQQAIPVVPNGPSDVVELSSAFNRMSTRIAAMLDEKDVMLGAIGHDLKTPLAALRIRTEMVEDDDLRARMVMVIDDLTRTLDEILSLARVGRSNEAAEPVNIGILLDLIAEEQRDLGADVAVAECPRLIVPLRQIPIRRALRNVIDNAVRYGKRARLSVVPGESSVTIEIEDDGPGLPEGDIERMFEPFSRLESSRNSVTGGTGLGLTLARAIVQQHGGTLTLTNRLLPDGRVAGLTARLVLPL